MKAIGIDQSETGTGIACVADTLHCLEYDFLPFKGVTGVRRIRMILARILDFVKRHQPDVIAMEGYAMNLRFRGMGRIIDLAELGGCIKVALWGAGYRDELGNFFVIPPTSNKKFAIGKGNATKEEMVEGVSRDARYPFSHDNDNVIDAYALAVFALALAGRYPLPLTKEQEEALRTLQDPKAKKKGSTGKKQLAQQDGGKADGAARPSSRKTAAKAKATG